jgi:hypothetical protein
MEKLRPEFVKLVKDCGFEVEDWREDILPDHFYFARILSSFVGNSGRIDRMKDKIRNLFTLNNYIRFTKEFNYFDIGVTGAYMVTIDYADKTNFNNSIAILHSGRHKTNRNVILFDDADVEISDKQAAKCFDHSTLRVTKKGHYTNWKTLFDHSKGYIMGRRFRACDNALIYSRGSDIEVFSDDVVINCSITDRHYIYLFDCDNPQVLHEPRADVNIRKCD